MATTKFNYGEDTLTYNLAFEIAEGKIDAGLSESQKKIISLSRKNVENALILSLLLTDLSKTNNLLAITRI